MKLFIVTLLLVGSCWAQAPVLFYSSIPTGMCTGGENGKGHWITITGQNFGASQDASHYVKITPAAGGASTTFDTYKYWNYTNQAGNKQISFQLKSGGVCLSDGDYDIQVVTPDGTSNNLPIKYGGTALSPNTHFHIYSGSTIYFTDPSNGSCNDSGSGTFGTPFCTIQKCVDSAELASGNTCYIMPSNRVKIPMTGCFGGAIALCHATGSSTKYISVLGYPTSTTANIPDLGCDYTGTAGDCDSSPFVGLKVSSSSFVAVGDIKMRGGSGIGTYETVVIGAGGFPSHHVYITNLDGTYKGDGATTFTVAETTYSQFAGVYLHNICDPTTSKHNGAFYIGETTANLDYGWSYVDDSDVITDVNCHRNKQVEIHPTAAIQNALPPTFGNGNLSATTGGSLANGIYDVYVSYQGQVYKDAPTTPTTEESDLSSVGKVTLSGANNAFRLTAPTGLNYLVITNGSLDDGVTLLCNPSQTLRVYACLESGGTCTAKYQGNTTYTNTSTQGGITAPDYVQTATLSTTQGYPTYETQYDLTGCFAYSIYVHDSKFYDAPGYFSPVNLGNGSKGPIVFYNNEIVNAGNGANNLGDPGDKLAGDAIEVKAFDNNAREEAQIQNIYFYNNTFYNIGGIGNSGSSGPGIIFVGTGASEPAFNATFVNNIFAQTVTGLPFLVAGSSANPNVTITGDHNLCFGNGTVGDCPAGWNTTGGQNATPSFTAFGTGVFGSAGDSGLIYTGFNTKPLVGSAAINNGSDTSSYGVLDDILGTLRPQQSIYDIGKDEYLAGGSPQSSTKGTAKMKGTSKTKP